MSNKIYKLLAALTFLFSSSIYPSIEEYFPYDVNPSSSNYGLTGILEMPNARFMKEASLRFNFSSSYPNEYTALVASPFNWMEASYRYAEIKTEKYGPSAYSGNQSLKDKGFDIKFKVMREDFLKPAVAIGFRDLAGTGLFSSEYIVASKKIKNLDITLGLGWGLLGLENTIDNPFSNISDTFDKRNSDFGQGGEFSYDSWFSGETAIFGGLEYELRKYGLRFKMEYDTSKPDSRQPIKKNNSRINFGLTYSYSDNLVLSSSLERGNTFRVGFNIIGNFLEDTLSKPRPRNVVTLSKDQKENIKKNNDIFYRSLNRSLRDESIYIQAANLNEKEVDVAIASSRFFSMTRSIGRTARIVSALSPPEIEKINIHNMNGDFEVAKVSLDKTEFDSGDKDQGSYFELLNKSELSSESNTPLYKNAKFMPKTNLPSFNWSMSPSIRHQIGGPEGFYLGQLLWRTDTTLKFSREFNLYTSFGVNIYDTFNNFNNPSASTIPHVRSDIQDYLREGKNHIQKLKFEYMSSPSKDIFLRLDLGYLEEMFGGIGGEVLYRPFNSRNSFGLSMHRLRQRDYDQKFSFRDYETTSGHFSIYSDLPYEISSQLMIGKYLAGDKGVTLDLSRRFKTGFILGVFATKTNLSSEEFGEGSFDKGFYFSIPLKLFYSDFRTGSIAFGLHPLTKDGGAILHQHNSLFSILGDTNRSSIERDWDYIYD